MNVGEIPTPVPGAGEVLLRAIRIGLRIESGKGLESHGIAGEVVAVGEGVEEVLPGEHYAIRSVVGCGECDECFGGRENFCPKAYHTHGFGEAGVFAELFVVPPAAITAGCLIRLPEGVDPDSGLFVEPLAFAIHGMGFLPIGEASRVVVIGAGLPGILAGIVARYRNAHRVIVCDPDPKRIDILRPLGLPFDEVMAGGDEAVSRVLGEAVGGVEAIICTIPDASSIRRSLAMAAIGGHVSLLVPETVHAEGAVDPAVIARRELHIHGASGACSEDYIDARHMVSEGFVPASKLVSRRFPLQEMKAAIDHLGDPAARPLAVTLEIPCQMLPPAPPVAERSTEEPAAGEPAVPGPAMTDWSDGLSEEDIHKMARQVREPVFDYGPGSGHGEIKPWPDLPPEYYREKEREKQQMLERERRREERLRRQDARDSERFLRRKERERGRPQRQQGPRQESPRQPAAQPAGSGRPPGDVGGRGRRRGRGRGRGERRGEPVAGRPVGAPQGAPEHPEAPREPLPPAEIAACAPAPFEPAPFAPEPPETFGAGIEVGPVSPETEAAFRDAMQEPEPPAEAPAREEAPATKPPPGVVRARGYRLRNGLEETAGEGRAAPAPRGRGGRERAAKKPRERAAAPRAPKVPKAAPKAPKPEPPKLEAAPEAVHPETVKPESEARKPRGRAAPKAGKADGGEKKPRKASGAQPPREKKDADASRGRKAASPRPPPKGKGAPKKEPPPAPSEQSPKKEPPPEKDPLGSWPDYWNE